MSEQMVLLNLKESQAKTVHQQLFARKRDSPIQHAPYLVSEIQEDLSEVEKKKEKLRPAVQQSAESSKLASHKTSDRYSLGWKNGNCEGEVELTENSHQGPIASHREGSAQPSHRS